MSHDKVGTKEQQLRDLAAKKRIEANKHKIDKTVLIKAKGVGRLMNVTVKKIGRRGK